MKLFDSELKVMEVLWEQGTKSARDIVDVLSQRIGWNKNISAARGDWLERQHHLHGDQEVYRKGSCQPRRSWLSLHTSGHQRRSGAQ